MEACGKSPSFCHTRFGNVFNVEGIFFTASAQRHKVYRTLYPGSSVSVHSSFNFCKIRLSSDNKLEINVTTVNSTILMSDNRQDSSIPRFSANTKFWGTTPRDCKSFFSVKILVELVV